MGKATIEEYFDLAGSLAVVDRNGLQLTNVSTSGTAANTNLNNATRFVQVFAEDTDVRVDVGVSVTADANARLVYAGTSYSCALPADKNGATYRVSIIDA